MKRRTAIPTSLYTMTMGRALDCTSIGSWLKTLKKGVGPHLLRVFPLMALFCMSYAAAADLTQFHVEHLRCGAEGWGQAQQAWAPDGQLVIEIEAIDHSDAIIQADSGKLFKVGNTLYLVYSTKGPQRPEEAVPDCDVRALMTYRIAGLDKHNYDLVVITPHIANSLGLVMVAAGCVAMWIAFRRKRKMADSSS